MPVFTVVSPARSVVPVTAKSVPTYSFFAIPTPPSIIVDPVVELDASVALLTSRTPAADTVSPVVEPTVVTPEAEARSTAPLASNVAVLRAAAKVADPSSSNLNSRTP